MVSLPFCNKNFAQCRAILERAGWQISEQRDETPDALLIAFHPDLPLRIAVYTLEDIQLLAQCVYGRYISRLN